MAVPVRQTAHVHWDRRAPLGDFIAQKNSAIDAHEMSLAQYVAEYMVTLKEDRPELHGRLVKRIRQFGNITDREKFIAMLRQQVQLDHLARTPSDTSPQWL